MAVSGKITVDTEVRTAGWTKGLSDAGRELKNFVRGAESTWKSLTFNGGKSFDVGGIERFGSRLAGLSSQAEGFATALRTGEGAHRAFTEKLESTPIAGNFLKAAASIHELVTGEEAAYRMNQKLGESARDMAASYRQVVAELALLGKLGDQRAEQEIKNIGFNTGAESGRRVEELQAKIDEIKHMNWAEDRLNRFNPFTDDEGLGSGDRQKVAQLENQIKLERAKMSTNPIPPTSRRPTRYWRSSSGNMRFAVSTRMRSQR